MRWSDCSALAAQMEAEKDLNHGETPHAPLAVLTETCYDPLEDCVREL